MEVEEVEALATFLFLTYIKQLENEASKKNGGSRKRVDVCRCMEEWRV